MPNATKICKVCGKTYPYCRSMRTVEGVYRWQDVACCPEHGSEYLTAIRISRGEIEEVSTTEVKATARNAKRVTKVAEETPLVESMKSDD